jgi:hypothetical protein
MEYLRVDYPRKRRVMIGGEPGGLTNDVIELEGGSYTVELSPPPNYTPASRRVTLANTSVLDPKVIRFEPEE